MAFCVWLLLVTINVPFYGLVIFFFIHSLGIWAISSFWPSWIVPCPFMSIKIVFVHLSSGFFFMCKYMCHPMCVKVSGQIMGCWCSPCTSESRIWFCCSVLQPGSSVSFQLILLSPLWALSLEFWDYKCLLPQPGFSMPSSEQTLVTRLGTASTVTCGAIL